MADENDLDFLGRLAQELADQGRYDDARRLRRFGHQHFDYLAREEAELRDQMALRCIMDGKPGILTARFTEVDWSTLPAVPSDGHA